MNMRTDVLKSMSREELMDYIRSLLWQYRLVDAFWFIRAEEVHGLPAAEELNARVWGKVGQLSARDLKKRFNITATGLEGFVQTLRLFPWAMMVGYEPRYEGNELIIEIAECPAQEGRKKHGLGEYVCKQMHHAEFEMFAQEVDPRIRVSCDFAPPDPHPDNMYCRWRFRLEENADKRDEDANK